MTRLRASETTEVRSERQRRHNNRLRSTFFEMYGEVCACCGEANKGFLTLEHKDGNPKLGQAFQEYRRAIKTYSPELFEVLCYNCNCSKKFLPACPHIEVK